MDSPRWRTASGDAPLTGSPLSSMVPRSGSSEPAAIAISVDLPAPFSPSRAWISPARASNVTPLSASTPSKLFQTPASLSTWTRWAVTAMAPFLPAMPDAGEAGGRFPGIAA